MFIRAVTRWGGGFRGIQALSARKLSTQTFSQRSSRIMRWAVGGAVVVTAGIAAKVMNLDLQAAASSPSKQSTDAHEAESDVEPRYDLKLFSGSANPKLSQSIAHNLGVPLGKCKTQRFADGELFFQVDENVRGSDVFVIQPTCTPVNENLMELLIMLDAFKRSSPKRITAVVPYYGYARQDSKLAPRVPISAKLVADLLAAAGAQRVITVDLHANQIQGFFDIPLDNLHGAVVCANYFKDKKLENIVIVSPDAGGVKRAMKFRDLMAVDDDPLGLAVISKQRGAKANTVETMQLVGTVEDCDCIIVDDMIDTAGTLVKAAEIVKAAGARRVFAMATHGVMSHPAAERINDSVLEEVVLSDSIPLNSDKHISKIKIISIAPLLAEAIRRIHLEQSVSSLFEPSKKNSKRPAP